MSRVKSQHRDKLPFFRPFIIICASLPHGFYMLYESCRVIDDARLLKSSMHVSALRVQLQGVRHAVSTAVSAGTWDQLGFLTLRLVSRGHSRGR